MNLITKPAAFPPDCFAGFYQCMTCDEKAMSVPTPAVAKEMRRSHKQQFPAHHVKVWFLLPPVELP